MSLNGGQFTVVLFLSVRILTVLTSDQRMLQWTKQGNNPGKFIAVQLSAEHTPDPGDTDSPYLIIHKKMPAEPPMCWALVRTQNRGICTSTDLFHKHSVSCTHLLPFSSLSHSSLGFTHEKVGSTNEKGKERVERRAEVSNDADGRSLAPVTSSPLIFQLKYTEFYAQHLSQPTKSSSPLETTSWMLGKLLRRLAVSKKNIWNTEMNL